jgi:hypothetical protein
MFMTIIIVLCIGQMYLEFQIAHALHMEELSRKFILVNLSFSIMISLLFTWLFPAAGMTIAAAGLASTVLSQPMYRMVAGWRKHAKPTLNQGKAYYAARKETINQYAKDLATVIGAVIVVVTFPVRVIRVVANAIRKIQGVASHAR